MVAQNPALFLATGSHTSASFRRLTEAATFDGEGVVGADDLQVVQHASGANLSVDVTGGRAYIRGTEAAEQGTYFVDNSGTVVLPVPAPDSRLDRIDLVTARVRDGAYSGTVNAWDLHYQEGTPAANPTAPTAGFNSLTLAEIRIPSGLGTVTNAQITDRRTRAFTSFIEPFMVASIDAADVTGNVPSATTALTAGTAGTATTAGRLGTPRTIALTGDAVGSATFDGSTNIAIEVQSALTADDIPGLPGEKITTGTIDPARLPTVTLATGPVQATTITATGDLDIASKVLFVDASGGNVGINHPSPNVALDVTGDTWTSGLATFRGGLDVEGDTDFDNNTLYIDTTLNRVGVGTGTPAATLDVVGSLDVSAATNVGGALTVSGTAGLAATTISGGLNVGSGHLRVRAGGNVTISEDVTVAGAFTTGSGTITGGLTVGGDELVVDAVNNRVGVGREPVHDFDVAGTARFSGNVTLDADLDVSGTISGTISATQITTGTLPAAQVPDLPASKITTGTFRGSRIPDLPASRIASGTFTTARIPSLPASKITTGTLAAARIPNLDAGKITSGTISAARLPPVTGTIGTATNLAGGTVDATTITASGTLDVDEGTLYVDTDTNRVGINTNSPIHSLDVVGTGRVTGSFLTGGTLTVTGATTLAALTVTGEFTGTLAAGQVTSGTFTTTRIPSLPTSKITSGTFRTSRIPDLPASRITSGTLSLGVIPQLSTSYITRGTFPAARIPDLLASKITGVFAVERIPGLDASKIITGTIDPARLPSGSGGGGGFTGGALTATTITGTGDLDIASKVLFVDASTGHVGINHDNPGVSLDVVGDTWTSGLATFRGDVNVNEGNLFVDVSAGRVGVGTETPTKTLDVDGDQRTTGALAVGGNTELGGRLIVTQTAILNDVTATTLTVDNLTLVVDSANNRVGVGTSTPTTTLGVAGTLGVTSNTSIAGDLTAGTGALTVSGAQNRVGINQTSPEHALDVDGTARITGTLRTQNISAFGNLTVSGTTRTTDTASFGGDTTVTGDLTVSGTATFGALDASQITTGTIDAARLPASTGGTFTGGALTATTITGTGTLDIDSGTLYVDPALNRVGINDQTPEHSLDIDGTLAVRGASFHTGAAGFGVLNASGNVTVDTDTFHVDVENNRVGIGTVDPDSLLHVAGTLQIDGRTTMTQGITVGGTDLVVNTATNRVGIGVAEPSVALDVLGQINTSTDIVADGNVEVGGALTVDAAATISGQLTMTGSANFSGPLTNFSGSSTNFSSPNTRFSGHNTSFTGPNIRLDYAYNTPGTTTQGIARVRIPKIWVQNRHATFRCRAGR